jgi:hypothetical protein
MPRPTIGAVVITHAGPFILPLVAAASALIGVAIPGHRAVTSEESIAPQTVIAAGSKIQIAAIPQILELLTKANE